VTVTATGPRSRTTALLMMTAALVIVLAGIKSASHIVAPVMLSLALTIVFYPLRARLERRMPGWLTSVIVMIAAIAVLLVMALCVVLSIAELGRLIPQYATEFDDLVADVTGGLESLGVATNQTDAVTDPARAEQLLGVVNSVLSSVVSTLSGLFFIVTLLAFLAFDSAKVARLADGARAHRPEMVDALISFARGTMSYLGVSAVFGLIVAVIDTVLLYALGVPGAFVWGVLAFITNFIPNIGFVIGIIPPAIIGLLEGGPSLMLAVIVLYCLVNLVLQSFIQPRYVGEAVGLSTSLTFLSLVFWTWILGPVGALMAVPMSLLFRAILIEADPEGRWRLPLISGDPDEPAVT
jgi:AI-2 transport protein TqsA